MLLLVGLTGGIASGKSAVAAELRRRGLEVIDADQLAREVVEPGRPAFDEIIARFGDEVVGADGRLDRATLGRKVFADRSVRTELEAITHPRIARAAQQRLGELERLGCPIAVYEVPLLIEAGMMSMFDRVVVVAARSETQIERLVARDGISEAEAKARLSAQMPTDEKLRLADHVIWNEGSLEELRRAVGELYDRLLALVSQRSW